LGYIKDLKSHVVLMGDYNSASVDISPTNLRKIGTSFATDKSNWLSALITVLTPQSTAINTSRRIGNAWKNYQDPLAPNIPVVLPNKVKPMFDRIGEFRFDDGAVFDCRGDARRSITGVERPLANANHRSRYKGFKHSFSVKRPIGLIGQQRLDWVFVKRRHRYEGVSDGPYRLSPHFGETLYEFNCGLKGGPVSDHSPNIVELPLEEPDFTGVHLGTFKPTRYDETWPHLMDPPDTKRLTFSERLKCRPLDASHHNVYHLGFNARVRWLNRDLESQGRSEGLEFQGRFHAALELKSGWRFYAEGISAVVEDADAAGLSSEAEDNIDLLNAFVEAPFGPARLRLGRQMFEIGEGRVLSMNPWAGLPTSWDGFHLQLGEARLFGGWRVELNEDSFNEADTDESMLGFDLNLPAGWGAYALFNQFDKTDAELATLGLRYTAQFGGFDLDAEAAVQVGDSGDRDHLAGMASGEIGYLFADMPALPRPWIGIDYASGD
ncbi:MAG: alginate export family protein, partial [Verrucomicrobiota bacterium]